MMWFSGILAMASAHALKQLSLIGHKHPLLAASFSKIKTMYVTTMEYLHASCIWDPD
jgi:hypothetical protein